MVPHMCHKSLSKLRVSKMLDWKELWGGQGRNQHGIHSLTSIMKKLPAQKVLLSFNEEILPTKEGTFISLMCFLGLLSSVLKLLWAPRCTEVCLRLQVVPPCRTSLKFVTMLGLPNLWETKCDCPNLHLLCFPGKKGWKKNWDSEQNQQGIKTLEFVWTDGYWGNKGGCCLS